MTNRLFEPTTIAGLKLKNHVAMAPLTRQRADRMGVPQPCVTDYYSQRSGAGLVIAEGTQPSFAGQGYCRTPGIHTAEQVAPSAVKPAGKMWTDPQQMQDFPVPHALETSELGGVVEEFVVAARNAIEAGFDGVELHAANGYLLNQFLATNTNQRTDAYGGSVNGRIRFVVEVTEAVAAAIGAARTAIRVSPGHMFNDLIDANPLETHRALLDALPTEKMAYVHVMLPNAFSPQLNNAGDPDAVLPALRPHVRGALLAAGNLTLESANAALDSGLIQVAVFGRPFIANPDLVSRFASGAPLAAPRVDLFYTPGPEGYSDYPSLAA